MSERIPVSHPGVYLLDNIEALGMTQNEFAIRTGILPKTINTIINGTSPITFDIAYKLSLFFGTSVELWVNLQTAHNMYLIELEKENHLEEEWEVVKLFKKNFIEEVCRVKYDTKNKEETINELRRFFMVSSLKNLQTKELFSFCRTSVQKEMDAKQIILRNAWISSAIVKARDFECSEYDPKKMVEVLPKIKKLMFEKEDIILQSIQEILKDVGVKFIFLPYLPGSNTSGVTRWISSDNAVLVAVNGCGKDADKFWFNVFHELGHAYQNKKRYVSITYDLTPNEIIEEEIEANEFAKNHLIDMGEYNKFIYKYNFSYESIAEFAKKINVPIFIVIGRLQRDKFIPWNKFQEYKLKYNF